MFHQYFDPLEYLERVLQLRVSVRQDRVQVSGLSSLSPYMRTWATTIVQRYEGVIKIQVANDRMSVSTLIVQGKIVER
ncbi:hypothetical protein [Desulfovermiculus halophilus]|jgi:hypothetical protein|uniref:hypothetical protein n=1 Tax=Desulfovermiculus halophilus TaxID=339722 RepID=UPI00048644C5|nr:hypothetical protein [Desulfovermiculus halophilus]